MVAIVNSNSSLRHTFHYNENKIKDGRAKCLIAGNYPMELGDMQQIHRLNMLLKIGARNDAVDRKCMHITLNFAPGEMLSEELKGQIATEYMEMIGFGEQPYLVYNHSDAGHPHLHIVTTKVRHDGTSIDTYNIGRNQSRKARIELESKYGLVQAQRPQKQNHVGKSWNVIKTALENLETDAEKKFKKEDDSGSASKVVYGKTESKKAIKDVLNAVINRYRYSSIEQLNAVLGLHNVYADMGKEGSRLRKLGGLLYHILDANGNTIGVPIKASSFYSKPTLKNLQVKFLQNKNKSTHFVSIRNSIDRILFKPKITFAQFKDKLRQIGIALVERRGENNVLFGVTYVDHKQKCVVNGRELGSEYAANGLKDKLLQVDVNPLKSTIPLPSGPAKLMSASAEAIPLSTSRSTDSSGGDTVLDLLTQYEYTSEYLPYQLKRRKKRKKKKN